MNLRVIDNKIEIAREDEIGELGSTLNKLSSKLKDNMNDLRSYGEKIKQINMGKSLQILQSVSIFSIQYNCTFNVVTKNRLYRNFGNFFMRGMNNAYRLENKFVITHEITSNN